MSECDHDWSVTLDTGEPYSPQVVIINGTRYTPAPDTHGHASVEDWLASKGVYVVPSNMAGRPWEVTKNGLALHFLEYKPTYLAARDAAVAWVKEQEASDAN